MAAYDEPDKEERIAQAKQDLKDIFKKPLFGFYATSGTNGVIHYVKKSPLLHLYRLIRFFEWNPFVLDQQGQPVQYNHDYEVVAFLKRNIRYAQVTRPVNAVEHVPGKNGHMYPRIVVLDVKNACKHEYDNWWADSYTAEQQKADHSLNPRWPYPYHQQFHLEHPLSSRTIIEFWTP